MSEAKRPEFSRKELQEAIQKNTQRLEEYFMWVQNHMPASFFEEVSHKQLWLITQNLMGFDTHDFFCQINLKHSALVLCLDSSDADLKILKKYQMRGIKNYRAFISNAPPPFLGAKHNLRIAVLTFTSFQEEGSDLASSFPERLLKEAFLSVQNRNPEVDEKLFYELINTMGSKFLRAIPHDRLAVAIDMFFRAKHEDCCQYEIKKIEDWKNKKDTPSLQIVLAWKNVPKHNFLYRLSKMLKRHNLSMKRVNAAYIDGYSKNNILLLSIGINGIHDDKAAWEATNLEDFLKELTTLKYFDEMELIEKSLVETGLLSGNQGNLLKVMCYFVHQMLLQADINLYSLANVEEGLCRHVEFTKQIVQAFEYRFDPLKKDVEAYERIKTEFFSLIEKLDTGHEMNDRRRKNILIQAMHFVENVLKTNVYTQNKTAFSFRLDPNFLERLPYERKEKFPTLPFGVFFMKGMHYMGFHIRFKDLSRGGLRTVIPSSLEQMSIERSNVFAECYGLAYTQLKKNKDIPEGGAKGVIFLEPYETLLAEEEIYRKDLEDADFTDAEIQDRLKIFNTEQRLEYLFQTQRSYIESFMTLINCQEDGTLKASGIIDYWQKPEYIYLGPDENMRNEMIEWIANYSQEKGYKPKGCFISSKPGAGINHKEYGVTSFGVNEYMEQLLQFMGINPQRDVFTIKISGGPDGDVAGNEILNLYRFYPKTAKLLAITDGSGTIYDPKGLDLEIASDLFHEAKPIRCYPPKKLSEGGFLLDLRTKKEESAYAESTLLWRKENGKVKEDWLNGNEMNHLYRHNVHSVKTDIFIPAGGRPKTLNDANFTDFLDDRGKPTAKGIVEGANLYITPWARKSLEKLGVYIFKDSSANKGGVICSSFEVLCGLVLSDKEFISYKPAIMQQVLDIIKDRARDEAQLILRTFQERGTFMTDLSEEVSQRINEYKYQILDCISAIQLTTDLNDPLNHCLLKACPKLIKDSYAERVVKNIPDIHKKAIIACFLASKVVYKKGLSWSPGIAEVIPLLLGDPEIMSG